MPGGDAVSHYIGDYATLVYGPYEKRKDGRWSKRRVIYAAFREKQEAHIYVEIMKHANVPVSVKWAPIRNIPAPPAEGRGSEEP